MGFFAALGRLLSGESPAAEASDRERLLKAWDLHEEPASAPSPPESPATPPGADATHAYDRQQWHRKLRTILDRLPESRDQWDDLIADVGALGLDPRWVREVEQQEFVLLVRRAVADRCVTPSEHQKLEMARTLLDMNEQDAEAILRRVVGEAEAFFGGRVERGR